MLFGGDPPLEQGERRVIAVRAHAWSVLRTAWPLPLLALSPALYAALDVALPSLRLATVFTIFFWVVAAAFVVYTLKWLALDLLPWTQRVWILTDRRIIAQAGVLSIRRRECSLLKIQESDYASRGLMARLFDIGDVEVETAGALGAIVMRDLAHPREVQALISEQARALREDVTRRHLAEAPDEVVRQLEAVIGGRPSPHTAVTQAVRPVSPRAAKVQGRLNLLPDEAVVAVTRRHGVVLALSLFPPLLAALLALAVALVAWPAALPLVAGAIALLLGPWVLWRTLTYLEHEYVLTTDRLMELRGTPLVFQMRDIMQLSSVQDVTLEIPTIFGRLANVGDVVVEVAGPDERVVLKTVARPAELQKLIFETIDARQRRVQERDDQRLIATLGRWFTEYHKLHQGDH